MRRRSSGLPTLQHLATRLRSRRLFAAADGARDRGDWPAAAQGFEHLCRLFPLSAPLHVQRGNMLKESGRFGEAQQAYDLACWLEPRLADVWLQIGHLAKLQDRVEDALAAYGRSAELDPSRPDAGSEIANLKASGDVGWEPASDGSETRTAAAGPRLPRARFASASASMLALERLKVALADPAR